jgi:hypothetical protein
MIWSAFLFGLGLLITTIGLVVFTERTMEVLGLGAIGVVDWVAIFLYKPMDRLQKANADYVQQFTILKGWATTLNLQLLAMNVDIPETITDTANRVQETSIEVAKALQQFIE